MKSEVQLLKEEIMRLEKRLEASDKLNTIYYGWISEVRRKVQDLIHCVNYKPERDKGLEKAIRGY